MAHDDGYGGRNPRETGDFKKLFLDVKMLNYIKNIIDQSYKYKLINGFIDCFFRINQDRINDYYKFLMKDIKGKDNYKYFSNIIKGSKRSF